MGELRYQIRKVLVGISLISVALLLGCNRINTHPETIRENNSGTVVQEEALIEQAPIAKVIDDLEWKWMTDPKEETMLNGQLVYPKTSLYLTSKTNPTLCIDLKHQVVGIYQEDEQGRDIYPKDAYLPLSNWFAGGGENIMIKLENATSFYVMVNPVEEGTPDYIGRGPSTSWQDYLPIAKVTYKLDEKGSIKEMSGEIYEVDYSAFFKESKPVPLQLEYAVWERKTKHGPSSWYRLYLNLKTNREETIDLGLYLSKPQLVVKEEIKDIKDIKLPKETIAVLQGTYEEQERVIKEYFILYLKDDYLRLQYTEVNHEEFTYTKEIYKQAVTDGQDIQLGEMKVRSQPYIADEGYHPVVYNGSLLGGSKDNMVYSYLEMCQYIHQDEHYKVYSLEKGYIKEIEHSQFSLKQDNVINANSYRGEIQIDEKMPYLAVSGTWEAMPRIPKAQSIDSYQKFFPNATILQNYRIDIEGDGQDEVVLILQEEGNTKLILRKIGDDGTVHTMRETISLVTEDKGRIVAIADVQNDGVVEIVVESEEWGNPGYKVYGYQNGSLYEVFGDVEDIHCWH